MGIVPQESEGGKQVIVISRLRGMLIATLEGA